MRNVGRRKEESLDRRFEELEAQWPAWTWLRTKLRKAGLTPTSARELRTGDRRSSWVILTQPSEALARHFELAPEVVVLCSPWAEMQANDIRWTEDLFRDEIRVDPGFALVIARDLAAESRLGAVVPEHRRYLFVSDAAFETALDSQAFLDRLLRESLGGRRLFDFRSPAAGPQFFGRERELEAVERDVMSGHCLGVYGLRKVGKTSLLRRLADKFRGVTLGSERVFPVMVDLLQIRYNRRSFAGALALIGRELDLELGRAQLDASGLPGDLQDRFAAAVCQVESERGARILLILDEYEVLVGGRIPVADGLALLEWLRGVAQTHPRGFSLVLAGRNSRLLAPARIDGSDNPMYRFLREVPLSGLAAEECRAMVRKIGARMALRFTPGALDSIVRLTGGHPALVRTLGDLVDQEIPTSARTPAVVEGALVEELLPRFSRGVDEDMRELVDASNDLDPRAIDYLQHLAHEVPWIGGSIEARINDALVGYGILERGTHALRIGHFGTWLRENYARPAEAAHG